MKKSIGLCVLAFAMAFMFSGMGNAADKFIKPLRPPITPINKYVKPIKMCNQWEDIWLNNQQPEHPRSLHVFKDEIYVGTLGINIYKLGTDDEWEQFEIPDNQPGISAFASDGNYLFAGGEFGVFKLDGNQWIELKEDIDSPNIVHALAVLDGTLFAGTNNGLYSLDVNEDQPWKKEYKWTVTALYVYEKVLYMGTTNGVYKWASDKAQPFGEAGQKKMEYVEDIINFEDSFYAGTRTGIFKLKDNGVWYLVQSATDDVNFEKYGDSLLTSIYKEGIFHSNDGDIWQKIKQNVANNSINDMLIKDNLLYAATSNDVWIILIQCLPQ